MTNQIGKISLYLSKADKDFEDVLDSEKIKRGNRHFNERIFEASNHQCRFYCKEILSAKNANPIWLDFVNTKLSDGDKLQFGTTTKRPSGLLLIKLNDRVMAAVFGTSSRSWISKSAFEQDFGIKVAMNLCGNEELRQTKNSVHSYNTAMIDRQMNRPSESFEFGMGETELLRFISASLKNDKKVSLQGKDTLTIKIIGDEKFEWTGLIENCNQYLEAYESDDTYKQLFPNYPNLTAVSEEDESVLNEKLVEKLVKADYSNIYLSIPDFIPDDEFSFSYTNSGKKDNWIVSHLEVMQLSDKKTFGADISKLDLKAIKNKKVFAYSHDEDKILGYKSWSLFSCIVTEVVESGSCYILSSGTWRKVDDDFYKSVNDFIDHELTDLDVDERFKNVDISDVSKGQNREDIFNETYCDSSDEAVKFDKAKLRIGEGRKDKEFCDILELSPNNRISIIHVKKFGGCSSINYLFSQARFYCESFLKDQVFLNEIREYLGNVGCSASQSALARIGTDLASVNGASYKVKLWLLYDGSTTKPNKTDLPLMAKYELKLTHDMLRNQMKFNEVSLSMIPVRMTEFKKSKDIEAE